MELMVDLETLSVRNNAAFFQIGAVAFGTDGNYRSFFTAVNAQDCINAGLRVDFDTVKWWLLQDEQARNMAATETTKKLHEALRGLSSFYVNHACTRIWSNGAAFDVPILETAYRKCGITPPWYYSDVRCARTVYALAADRGFEYDKPFEGVPHVASDDAYYQVRKLQAALGFLDNA